MKTDISGVKWLCAIAMFFMPAVDESEQIFAQGQGQQLLWERNKFTDDIFKSPLNGNIAIGLQTADSNAKVDVLGNLKVRGKIISDFITVQGILKIGNSISIGTVPTGIDNTIFADNGNLLLQSDPSYNFNTFINSKNSGSVGIGTTSVLAGFKLHIGGNAFFDGNIRSSSLTNASTNIALITTNSSGDFLKVAPATSATDVLHADGTWAPDQAGAGAPGGCCNGALQFANSGAFGGSSNLIWNNANNILNIGNVTTNTLVQIGGSSATTNLNLEVKGAVKIGHNLFLGHSNNDYDYIGAATPLLCPHKLTNP